MQPKPDKFISLKLAIVKPEEAEQKKTAIIELKSRCDKIGIDCRVYEDKNNLLAVELKTNIGVDSAKKLLLSTVDLGFYEVYHLDEMMPYFIELNTLVSELEDKENVFFEKVVSQGYVGGPQLLTFSVKDTTAISNYLSYKEVYPKLPVSKKDLLFAWGLSKSKSEELALYALKKDKKRRGSIISGKRIKRAFQSYNSLDQPVISIEMDEKGALEWKELTTKVFRDHSQIAIVINGTVYSAPGVSSPIEGGRSEVSGQFTVQEAKDLAFLIESGNIPTLKVLTEEVNKLN